MLDKIPRSAYSLKMKEILQFEPGELTVIMMWYFGHPELTLEQLRKKLNGKLREKAEASRDQEEQSRPVHRPNCF